MLPTDNLPSGILNKPSLHVGDIYTDVNTFSLFWMEQPAFWELPQQEMVVQMDVSLLAVLTHGHSVYAGILVLIFDIQSGVDNVHVIRY